MHRKSHFRTTFVSIAICIGLFILIFSLFLYVMFKENSIHLLNSSNEAYMKQVIYNAESVHEHIGSYGLSLFHASSTKELMYNDTLPIREVLSAMNTISLSIAGNVFIDSAYVYNAGSNNYYVFGEDRWIRQDHFYDETIPQILKTFKVEREYPIARKVRQSPYDEQEIEVLTYIFAEYYPDKNVKNAVILNVRTNTFFQRVRQEKLGDERESFFVNGEGLTIVHESADKFLEPLTVRGLKEVLEENTGQLDYAIKEVEGRRMLVSSLRSEQLNWNLINLTPYSYVMDHVQKARMLSLLIFAVTLVIGIVIAFFLSRRLYHPLLRVRRFIKQRLQVGDKQEAANEFEDIIQSFSSVHQEYLDLSTFRTKNLNFLKEQFLQEWLRGTHAWPQAEEKAKELALRIEVTGPIQLIMMRIDHMRVFKHLYNSYDRSLMRYAMMNIALEIIGSLNPCDGVNMDEDQMVLFINLGENEMDWEQQQPKILEAIRHVQASIKKYLGLSISASIGEWVDNVSDIPYQYQETVRLSQQRLHAGHGCLLTMEDLPEKSREQHPIDHLRIAQLLDALREGRYQELEERLAIIINDLHNATYNEAMLVLNYLAAGVFDQLHLIEKHQALSFEIVFTSFIDKLKEAETREEIQQAFSRLFQSVQDQRTQFRDQRTLLVVQHVIEYVRTHYTDIQLSAGYLADRFRMTPAHLNKLFRLHAAKSISETITEVRLEEAKRLLVASTMTVEQIVEKIGWENKKYFFTVFKKHFGVTPNEYRLKEAMHTEAGN